MRPWRPVLDGEVALEAERRLLAIVEALRDERSCDDDPSVNGLGGRALLWSYLDRARPDEGFDELAADCLDRAIDCLATAEPMTALFGGFVGAAWVVDHLDPTAEEDLNEQIDEALFERLQLEPWPLANDLISGLGGFGLYALGRLHRPRARACLERVVEQLEQLATPRAHGLAWRSPRGVFDYGVAHGVPALVLVLAGARRAGVAAERAAALYEGAMRWQWAGRLPSSSPSAFGYHEREGEAAEPARLAWCYGDAGAAVTLLEAARAVGDEPRAALAVEVAHRARARDPEQCGADDAAFCHGSAGIAFLFARLWHETGDAAFAEASRRWYARLCRQSTASLDGTLLTGTTGVALSLLAGVSAVAPAWDGVFAASLPSGTAP